MTGNMKRPAPMTGAVKRPLPRPMSPPPPPRPVRATLPTPPAGADGSAAEYRLPLDMEKLRALT